MRDRKNSYWKGCLSDDFFLLFPFQSCVGVIFMCSKHTVDSIFGYFIARIQFIDLAIGARCLSVHLIDKKEPI